MMGPDGLRGTSPPHGAPNRSRRPDPSGIERKRGGRPASGSGPTPQAIGFSGGRPATRASVLNPAAPVRLLDLPIAVPEEPGVPHSRGFRCDLLEGQASRGGDRGAKIELATQKTHRHLTPLTGVMH